MNSRFSADEHHSQEPLGDMAGGAGALHWQRGGPADPAQAADPADQTEAGHHL